MSIQPDRLLNECRNCRMKFENSQQLGVHLKKFCQGTAYGDLQNLEKKAEDLKFNNPQAPISAADIGQLNNMNNQEKMVNVGKMSMEDIKGQFRSNEVEFQKLEKLALRKREEEMEDELIKLKKERQNIRLKNIDDDAAFAEILQDLEQRKERELRTRIEKEQIRRAIVDLEKNKLSALEQEKKKELEKLAAEREMLKLKEDELMNDVIKFEENVRQLDRIKKEEMDRVNQVAEGYRGKQTENRKINELLLQEKADRIATLKVKREQLENERIKIMDNLDRIKAGDLQGARRNAASINVATSILRDVKEIQNYNIPNMKDKLHNNIDKIDRLKRDQKELVRKEMLPYDEDEGYMKSNKQGNFISNVANYVESTDFKSNYDHRDRYNKLGQIRQNLEKNPLPGEFLNNSQYQLQEQNTRQVPNSRGGQQQQQQQQGFNQNPIYNAGQQAMSQPNFNGNKALQDINNLKQAYSVNGGQDPRFIQNLNNLENFYSKGLQQTQNDTYIQQQQQYQSTAPASFNGNIPPQFQSFLNQKDIENQKLKQEIDGLKQNTDKINNMLKQGNFTLQDMNLKMGGFGGPSGFDIYSNRGPTGEFFLANEVRSIDLSEEEKVLLSLQAQEVDALRILSMIPIGTELYRYKMEQYKELSTTRSEIDKIVQEQRLQKLRREFEKKRREEDRKFENDRWIDEQRRNIFLSRLRRTEPSKGTGQKYYDPTEGFTIHWDFTLGLPIQNDYAQLAFGVYSNGETLYPPSNLPPHYCDTESSVSKLCVFSEKNDIQNIPANPYNLIIWEVQLTSSSESGVAPVESYGWTMIDIFDASRQLKRGKFKCPLYVPPTDPSIFIDDIKNLQLLPSSWFYVRISYPFDDEQFGKHEYVVPAIHLRQTRPRPGNFTQQPSEPSIIYPPKLPTPPMKMNQTQTQLQVEPDKTELTATVNNTAYDETIIDKEKSRIKEKQKKPVNETFNTSVASGLPNVGLSVVLNGVKGHVATGHLVVTLALYEGENLINDDNGTLCTYTTSIHNPLTASTNNNNNNKSMVGGPQMSNKAVEQDIIFNEEHSFLASIPKLLAKNKGRKDIYLVMQVIEKPQPKEILDTTNEKGYKTNQANFGGMEYELFGWYIWKINNSDGSLNTGRFTKKLYDRPFRKPPIDQKKVNQMEDIDIDFTVEELEYDTDMLEEAAGVKRKKNKSGKNKKNITSNNESIAPKINPKTGKPEVQKEVVLDNSPFIRNNKDQYLDKPFDKGMGIDFYIDQVRFLPDVCTVCKVILHLYNQDYEEKFEPVAGFPDLGSSVFSPEFSFRFEIRSQIRLDPTLLAFIELQTWDKSTDNVRRIGYGCINLFINRYKKEQPEQDSDQDVALLSGHYQIPIICQEPIRAKPFNMQKLKDLDKLPCASILIRINNAPLTKDGLRVLSLKDVPKQDWVSTGIWPSRPLYATGIYNTKYCPVRDSEKELFIHRSTRTETTVREAAYLLINADGISKQMSDKEIKEFLSQKISGDTGTKMIDMLFFAKYREDAGFKFSLDGVHNCPKGMPYIGLYCVSPPGTLYTDNPDYSQIQLQSNIDWESPVTSQRFVDGWFNFKDVRFDKNLCIIVDIRYVSYSNLDPEIIPFGWTVVPVFNPNRYVMSGIYQIPLIKGTPKKQIVEQLPYNDPWALIDEKIKTNNKKEKIEFIKYSSVIVRILDSQREGHFNNPFDYNRIDYKYLPEKDLPYFAYNGAVDVKLQSDKKMSSIDPSKNPTKYNQKITNDAAKLLGLGDKYQV